MNEKKPRFHFSIWGFMLGYFIFYVPYSGMTKGLSLGLFSGNLDAISGFQLLPVVLFGTVLGFSIILLTSGWWRYAGTIKVLGKKIPFASNKYTFFSGIATAVIIATTTLAYSFTGISIVFAALLMRGGVLLLALFVDTVYRRKIQLFSWIAFGLTLFALLLGFSDKAGFKLGVVASINITAYLAGYFFRLQFMTYSAKTDNIFSTYKYFVEEMISAMTVIFFLPLLFAIIGHGDIMQSLRAGYFSFYSWSILIPSLIIGLLYAGLYIFGSRIYLDYRENTFCIPINRCVSLLAAVVGGIILSLIFEKQFYTVTQLISASILVMAIIVTGLPEIINKLSNVNTVGQQHYIFVCPGNTGRSPMAQLICVHHIKAKLKEIGIKYKKANVRVMSAAISGEEGKPMDSNAQLALKYLGIPVQAHSSLRLSDENILHAKKIWCMSDEHKRQIIDKFPQAESKVSCLDEIESIPIPHGKGIAEYIDCAKSLEQIINNLIIRKEIAFI